MRPEENIEKLIKNINIDTNADTDKAVLNDILRALENSKTKTSANIQRSIWVIVVKSRIAQVAAVLIVLSAICLLTLSDRGGLEQHETTGLEVAVISKTPSELVSAITLNRAFRDGGMRAMEKQFDKAEKKVKPELKKRLTVDQLICELNGC